LQNVMLVGINSEKQIPRENILKAIGDLSVESNFKLNLVLENPVEKFSEKAVVLKDDFAPAERLTLPLIKDYFNKYANWFYSL